MFSAASTVFFDRQTKYIKIKKHLKEMECSKVQAMPSVQSQKQKKKIKKQIKIQCPWRNFFFSTGKSYEKCLFQLIVHSKMYQNTHRSYSICFSMSHILNSIIRNAGTSIEHFHHLQSKSDSSTVLSSQ